MYLTKLLDPKNDAAFKKIFGTERNKDILIHFLNDMLELKSPIKEVVFVTTIQEARIAILKTSIVDIMVTDELGTKYVVEMQVASDPHFLKRVQYYAAKAYSAQLLVGEKYEKLHKVIFLAIADFDVFPGKKSFYSHHVTMDKDTKTHHLQDMTFTFFELPKFNKSIDELKTLVDKWCYFFKHAHEITVEDLEKIVGKDLIMKRAFYELSSFGWSEDEMAWYEQVEKRNHDYFNQVRQREEEEQRIENKRREVEEKSKEVEEKSKEVEEKYREVEEKIQHTLDILDKSKEAAARKLLAKNYPFEDISEALGLSKEQVKAIAAEMLILGETA